MGRLWIRDKAESLLQSHEQFITRDQIDDAVDDAIGQHGRNNPAISITDVVSDGQKRQAMPSSYVARASDILDIEYPIGEMPRRTIARGSYGVVDDIVLSTQTKVLGFTSAPKLNETYRVRNTTPVEITGGRFAIAEITVAGAAVVRTIRRHMLLTGETVEISGSDSTPVVDGPHVVTVLDQYRFTVPITTTSAGSAGEVEYDGRSNVAPHEEQALAHLSAHYGFLLIASRMAHSNRPDIEADVTNYDQKPAEFRRLAEEARIKYVDLLMGETEVDLGGTAFAAESLGTDALPVESRTAPDRHSSATVGGL